MVTTDRKLTEMGGAVLLVDQLFGARKVAIHSESGELKSCT